MDSDNSNRLKNILYSLSPEDGKYICKLIHRDQFEGIYPKLFVIYVFILGSFLLWPFNFISHVKNDAHWIKNTNGIEFLKKGQAVSNSLTQEHFNRLVKGSGLTLELWLQTEDLNQTGSATIFSYSTGTALRNFTVGQVWDKLIVALRTTKTNRYGEGPILTIPDVFTSHGLKYMVIIYNLSEQSVYINGEQKARSHILKGNFSNWDPSYRLVIGNNISGNRPWKGKIFYVAVYDRVLTEQEVRNNYLSEFQSKVSTRPLVFLRKGNTKDADIKKGGPVVRYLFNEGNGNVIHDSGSGLNPVNLTMPEYIRPMDKPFLDFSSNYLQNNSQYSDLIINILIFIPLGILIHGMLRTRYGLTLKISFVTLLFGTLFSLSIESLQYLSITRSSSLVDVSTNMTGIAIGIVLHRIYNLFLNYQAKHLQMLLYDRKD